MKRLVLLLFLTIVLAGNHWLISQDLPFRKEVNYIDSILNKNPYYEGFLGITYYYSIEISRDKEIIVTMDFRGPFKTTFSARVADLTSNFIVDTTEFSSSICWHCKTDETGHEKRCINQVNIYTTGEKDVVESDDICIMIPTLTDLRLNLIKSIGELIVKVREQ